MSKNKEYIIKEHRHWTQWIVNRFAKRLGNLVLTNHRLMFLHKIQSSPEVSDHIKKLADSPMENVLNYAFTLNRDNFQMPLSNIAGVKIGLFNWNPFPHTCLTVVYFDGKQAVSRAASFQFIRPIKQTILNPQIAVDINWIKTINKAIRDVEKVK